MRHGLGRHGWSAALVGCVLFAATAATLTADVFRPVRSADGMARFASEDQFRAFFRQRRAALEARLRGQSDDASLPVMMEAAATDAAAPPPPDSITNVQESGVDEGGIVKAAGDYLVVLRRVRLFTISIAGRPRAADSIDVPPPGRPLPPTPWQGGWYDEMLVAGDRVVVIGYSYERAGTEILRFRLSPDGDLTFEDAWHLRASDYYSAENYASRLIGHDLVLYNVRSLGRETDPMEALPALTDETPGRNPVTRTLARATDVFIDPHGEPTSLGYDSLHSITRCDLTAPQLDCSATAILGPWSRTFYVSPRAVYLWATIRAPGEPGAKGPPAMVYRLPLDGGRPGAVAAAGAPLDQFSFREDPRRNRLDVVVQSEAGGDGMWGRNRSGGATRLLRLDLDRFGDGSGAARATDYLPLPDIPRETWPRENRFVGGHLLFATGRENREGFVLASDLFAVDLEDGGVRRFDLPARVGRIEALGSDALVVGAGADAVTLFEVRLDGEARLGQRHRLEGVGESERRSHGFFFRPDRPGAGEGLLGLPVQRYTSGSAIEDWSGRVDTAFLRRDASGFTSLGALASSGSGRDDGCRVSCFDWYGQSRPIFLRGRVFALMGYELVEGRVEGARIREVARVDFTPGRG